MVLAIQILMRDGWITDTIGAATKLEVEVREPATRHTVTCSKFSDGSAGPLQARASG